MKAAISNNRTIRYGFKHLRALAAVPARELINLSPAPEIRELDIQNVPTRAITICSVVEEDPSGGLAPYKAIGTALCSPSDNFCKETGRRQALARAIKGLSRDDRRLMWESYFLRGEDWRVPDLDFQARAET